MDPRPSSVLRAAEPAAGATAALWDIEDMEDGSELELLGPRRASAEGFGRARRLAALGARTGGLLCLLVVAGTVAICFARPGAGSLGHTRAAKVEAKVGLSSALGSFLGLEHSERADVKHAPSGNLHDGNVCREDEELFEGLCYKQCRLLTGGLYPVRTSSWSCWAGGNTSMIWKEKVGSKIPIPCHDFDVAGDSMGGGCPHSPGSCLENEEIHLNVCYKKCSILTKGEYPHRVAAATCCKERGIGCLWKSITRPGFRVGGGKKSSNSSTPAGMHLPMKRLTEAGK